MNGQYNGERLYTLDEAEEADKNATDQPVNSNTFADKEPVDPSEMHETPMGGTAGAVGPMTGTVPYQAPMAETITRDEAVSAKTSAMTPLLSPEESEHLRARWNEIQIKFVDEPRSAVQGADALVTEVIGQITKMFVDEHSSLEGQWDKGTDASTEDLRKALQRYRSFFNRLVV